MSERTPEWVRNGTYWIHAKRGGAICELYGTKEQVTDHGNLIIAAPDLLAACKEVRSRLDALGPLELADLAVAILDAAIAKAEAHP